MREKFLTAALAGVFAATLAITGPALAGGPDTHEGGVDVTDTADGNAHSERTDVLDGAEGLHTAGEAPPTPNMP